MIVEFCDGHCISEQEFDDETSDSEINDAFEEWLHGDSYWMIKEEEEG